jgi:hypothetical protein
MANPKKTLYPLAEVLDVQIELASDDEMGQVKGGFLKLRGMLVETDYRSRTFSSGGHQDKFFVDGHETTMTLYDDMDYHECLASLGIPHMKLFCLPIEVTVFVRLQSKDPLPCTG